MQTEEMIPAEEFCIHHNKTYVPVNQLHNLEKLIRLYYELDINLEGIETITYLLQRMNEMQQKIVHLSNRLSLYENE